MATDPLPHALPHDSDEAARLQAAVAAAQLGTFDWNLRTHAVRLDARSREIFGFATGEGTTAAEVFERIHPGDREWVRELALATLARGERVDVEYRLQLPTGAIRHVSSSGTILRGAGAAGEMVFGVFADITERKWNQIRNEVLVELTDRLGAAAEGPEARYVAAEIVGTALGLSRVAYGLVETGQGVVRIERDWTAPGIPSAAGRYPLADYGALLPQLAAGEAVAIADTRADPRPAQAAAARRNFAAGAVLVLPIIEQGGLVAVLFLNQARPREWLPREIELVREVAERVRDSSERKQAEAGLRAADRRKDEFLATLAHELRNPLAPIRNGLQIARLSARGDATLLRTVDMMDRQLTHLVRLVDDLLDVGRISSGKLQLRRAPVSLAQVLASSMEATHVLLERHGHRLTSDIAAAELEVEGDFDRLAQVFTNLLSNAAKYTDPGGTIHLQLAREGGEAVVSVTDSGIGIAPEDLQQVFDLFSQVRTHQGRTEGGLGIGLALVRSLLALHGGRVEARSAGLGRGSTFVVHLPLLARAATREPDAAAPAVAASEPARRILVADDNVDAAATLATLLELQGHQVWTAEDGVVALEKARALRPDIVFLDLGMPRMGGLEAARHLRDEGLAPPAKLVAVTGWGQEADRERTRAAGFDAHLVKPVDIAALQAVLATAPASGVDNTAP